MAWVAMLMQLHAVVRAAEFKKTHGRQMEQTPRLAASALANTSTDAYRGVVTVMERMPLAVGWLYLPNVRTYWGSSTLVAKQWMEKASHNT